VAVVNIIAPPKPSAVAENTVTTPAKKAVELRMMLTSLSFDRQRPSTSRVPMLPRSSCDADGNRDPEMSALPSKFQQRKIDWISR